MMKKLIKTVLLSMMLLGLLLGTAFAVNANGSYGSMNWVLKDDGTLTISGSGEMPSSEHLGWLEYSEDIRSVVIKSGITSISDFAFECCAGCTTVSIPSTVTKIGENAFAFCGSLNDVTIPNSVTVMKACAFTNCESLQSVTIGKGLTSIPYSAFYYCAGLTTVTFASGCKVSKIENEAFAFTGITELIIPDSVKSIGEYAFYYSALQKVVVPDSVVTLGKDCFACCMYLDVERRILSGTDDTLFSGNLA